MQNRILRYVLLLALIVCPLQLHHGCIFHCQRLIVPPWQSPFATPPNNNNKKQQQNKLIRYNRFPNKQINYCRKYSCEFIWFLECTTNFYLTLQRHPWSSTIFDCLPLQLHHGSGSFLLKIPPHPTHPAHQKRNKNMCILVRLRLGIERWLFRDLITEGTVL